MQRHKNATAVAGILRYQNNSTNFERLQEDLKKSNNYIEYDIGIDIGNTSVGYAVTDTDGELLHFKKQNMWGARLFESASDSRDTRLARNARRRFSRRRQRIELLRDFFISEGVLGEDFFAALDASSTATTAQSELFWDGDHRKNALCRKYKTIYHLRKELCTSEEKADIRLIYLALHHIVKYRGNFNCDNYNGEFKLACCRDETLANFLLAMDERFPQTEYIKMFDDIKSVLYSNEAANTEKQQKTFDLLLPHTGYADVIENITKAVFGFAFRADVIFGGAKTVMAFSESEKTAEYRELLSDDNGDGSFYDCLVNLFFSNTLATVLNTENFTSISDSFIERYNKHGEQLAALKKLYRKYTDEKTYKDMFCEGLCEKSYATYIHSEKSCSYTELYKKIKADLAHTDAAEDKVYIAAVQDMKNEAFLRKLKGSYNESIPYQLNLAEMEAIIDRQGVFYPFLAANKKELLSLVSFRLPYYIGPLNPASRFSWAVRKNTDEKIRPWNFEETVDIEKTAEAFISRLSGNCSYLRGEKVLPYFSPLYSEFRLRNEIAQISVNGKALTPQQRCALFRALADDKSVFGGKRNITAKQLEHLISSVTGIDRPNIAGIRENGTLAADMRVLGDMRSIGSIRGCDTDTLERIVYLITVYKDKALLKQALKIEFPFITAEDVEKASRLNYCGWGKISRALLEEIMLNCGDTQQSIIDILRSGTCGFNRLITDSTYKFEDAVYAFNKYEEYDSVNDMIECVAGSPSIKKGIRECIKVIDEIVEIMGHAPRNIFMEFATEDRDSFNSSSRKDILLKKYGQLKEDEKYRETYDIIRTLTDDDLENRALFLYCLQNGRCLYSGKKIDIGKIGTDCVIDHIIPYCYYKDSSLENSALVLKNEILRTDDMLLDDKIKDHMHSIWDKMKKLNLISNKKYFNLLKDCFAENEIRGFIGKQLIEVRQITKHTANILKEKYCRNGGSTRIIKIKATLTNELRAYLKLPKNRNVNDFHHAHDAYICIKLGIFTQKCYPKVFEQFDIRDVKTFIAMNKRKAEKNTYGYIVGRFNEVFTDGQTGEILWNGIYESEHLANCLNYKDCFISKKTEEITGAFYKQNLRPAGESDKLIEKKKGLDTKRYGGYAQPAEAYSAVIEYDTPHGRAKKLIGIPLYIKMLANTEPDAVAEYINGCGYVNAVIIKDRILKYQKIKTGGTEYYLSSSTEVHNARQLTLPREINALIFMMNYRDRWRDEAVVPECSLLNIYDLLCMKIKALYPGYAGILTKLTVRREKFTTLEKQQKITVINEILNILRADCKTGNLQLLGLAPREGRKNKQNINVSDTVFINTSVTGMFESRIYGSKL